MNYKVLKESILKPCTISIKKIGEELNKQKAVKQVQGKRVEEVYHIYGKVESENKEIQTHIKYNLKLEKIVGFRCTCLKHIKYKDEGYTYYCEHIAATAFKFFDSIKVDINKKKENNNTVKTNKEILTLDIKLYYKLINNANWFDVELRIGNKTKYLIKDIKEFINSITLNKTYKLADTFTYNPKLHEINGADKRFIDLIKIKYKNNLESNSKIKVKSNELYYLLNKLPKSEITFKDNFLEYKTKINESPLPLAFNMKYINDKVILSSEKNLPTMLDLEGKVYLFNREIYLLNYEISKVFYPIYKDLIKNSWIYLPGNNDDINEFISNISFITTKVNMSDDFKEYISRFIQAEYTLDEKQGVVTLDVNFIYGKRKVNILKEDKLKLGCIRNYKLEDRVLMSLENKGFIKNGKIMFFKGTEEQLFEFLNSKNKTLLKDEKVIISNSLEGYNVLNSSSLKGDLYEEDWAIKISFGFNGVKDNELKSIFNAYKENRSFYKTRDNDYIDLTDRSIVNFLNVIDLLNIEKDLDKGMAYINKSKATLLDSLVNRKDLGFLQNKTGIKTLNDKLDFLNQDNLKLDKTIKDTLRAYQYDGIRWLNNLYNLDFGGILADEMGLGKTLQTIAFISIQNNTKSLIIVPTSLIYNWESEFNKFAPDIKVGIVYGDNNKRKDIINNYNEYDVLITTYGILKNELEAIKDIKFDICVIDEAQNIKNAESQNAASVKSVNSKWKLALTGTPIENNLLELWSIFDFVMPGFLYSKKDFENKFNKNNDKNIEFLKTLVTPFILRRTKIEVAKDLPNKIENNVMVNLTKSQRYVYNSFNKEVIEHIKQKNTVQVFAYLTRLRQICAHPKLVMEDYQGDSGKFLIAHNYIQNQLNNNGKVLVFSQFTSLIKLFSEELRSKSINYYILDGSTPSKERARLVKSFNSNDEVNVFLISLKAGGTGLNLTSANLVIHFDPWWNPAVESQASDRAHRIGQRKEVSVVKLIAKNTIEEKILLLQEDKKSLIDNILSGEDISNNINIDMIEKIIDISKQED